MAVSSMTIFSVEGVLPLHVAPPWSCLPGGRALNEGARALLADSVVARPTPIHCQGVTSIPSSLTCLCEYDGCSGIAYVLLR